MPKKIHDIIEDGSLPSEPQDILEALTEHDGRFIASEGETWDFKDPFPYSFSDDYFHGICRLCCAFANTSGGLIVFGVNDKTRLAKKSDRDRVIPNLDKFGQAFSELTGASLSYSFKEYVTADSASFDVLLVRPIDEKEAPLRFIKSTKKYGANIIWSRDGHEVVESESKHIAQLYCRSSRRVSEEDEYVTIDASLPPNPATLRQFIGRMTTIDRIFSWLREPDQPRTFLHGKGGSGKSTIAFEVARNLRDHGQGFLIENKEPLEKVIYLSAKEKELDLDVLKSRDFGANDFSDERSLYEAILTLGDTALNDIDDLSLEKLKEELVHLFSKHSFFIVIDDIDTLTTKGIEAGFEFLIGALYRGKRRSKILYTLRNAPSQSLSNSIAVPGLAEGGEYEKFVNLAAEQFGVYPPSQEYVSGELQRVSERRPLVLESIIALRRRVDSYDRAIELFEQADGAGVRDYVFRREWDAIKPETRGRELLAVLALHKREISFEDLVALMYGNDSNVSEALSAVQEMFIQTEQSGDTTKYTLNDLTRAFVLQAAPELDRFEGIKTRVQKFITNIYSEDPKLNSLLRNVEADINRCHFEQDSSYADRAWRNLMSAKEDVALKEDPRFMAVCGYTCLYLKPPNIAEAREYFRQSFNMRHSPKIQYIRRWYEHEIRFDGADYHTKQIYDLVMAAKGYDNSIRHEFIQRRASTLYNVGRNSIHSEPEKAEARLIESLSLHVQGYGLTYMDRDRRSLSFEKHARNTAFVLKNALDQASRMDDMISYFLELRQIEKAKFDPLVEPIAEAAAWFRRLDNKNLRARAKGRLAHLASNLDDASLWISDTNKKMALRACKNVSHDL